MEIRNSVCITAAINIHIISTRCCSNISITSKNTTIYYKIAFIDKKTTATDLQKKNFELWSKTKFKNINDYEWRNWKINVVINKKVKNKKSLRRSRPDLKSNKYNNWQTKL